MELITVSVLSLNIWGIPMVSKDKDIRVNHIAEMLAQSDYEIISLQEVSYRLKVFLTRF